MKGKPLYWIAVNGASCAASAIPLREPFRVIPTPEILVGFPTAKEAKQNQRCLLEAAFAEVREKMHSWMSRGDLKIIKPEHPDPPTTGPTIWEELDRGPILPDSRSRKP